MKREKYIKIILSLLLSLPLAQSVLQGKPLLPLILEGGVKSGYSTGLFDPYWYHRLYLKGGYRWQMGDLSAGYSRYFNYQISDTEGAVKFVDLHRMGAEGEIRFSDSVAFSCSLWGYTGDEQYRRFEGRGGVTLYFSKWSFSLEAGGNGTSYFFDGVTERIGSGDLFLEVSRIVSDTFSLDAGYTFLYTEMEGLEGIHKHLFRGGMTLIFPLRAFFFCGATVSVDSGNYFNVGLDAGGAVYVFRYVKLSVSYMLSWGNSFSTESNTSFPGPSGTTSTEVEQYLSHRIFLGAAIKYR